MVRSTHDSLPWITQRGGGHEKPAHAVLACMELCARCPVRIECLADTVGERAFTPLPACSEERRRPSAPQRSLPAASPSARTFILGSRLYARYAAELEGVSPNGCKGGERTPRRLRSIAGRAGDDGPTVTAAAPQPARRRAGATGVGSPGGAIGC